MWCYIVVVFLLDRPGRPENLLPPTYTWCLCHCIRLKKQKWNKKSDEHSGEWQRFLMMERIDAMSCSPILKGCLVYRARGVQTIRRPFDYEAFRLLFRQWLYEVWYFLFVDLKLKRQTRVSTFKMIKLFGTFKAFLVCFQGGVECPVDINNVTKVDVTVGRLCA